MRKFPKEKCSEKGEKGNHWKRIPTSVRAFPGVGESPSSSIHKSRMESFQFFLKKNIREVDVEEKNVAKKEIF